MSIKQIIKSILGQELINKIRGNNLRKEEIEVPEDDRTEIELRKAFYAQFIVPVDVCFDLGANAGNRIIPIPELEAKIVAVEPQ